MAADGDPRFVSFALKDYEMKVNWTTSHLQRMWTRFNYFVIIEAALIGGKTVFGEGELGIGGIAFGLGLSVLWYFMGAEDRYLFVFYRDDPIHLMERFTTASGTCRTSPAGAHRPSGDTHGSALLEWPRSFRSSLALSGSSYCSEHCNSACPQERLVRW